MGSVPGATFMRMDTSKGQNIGGNQRQLTPRERTQREDVMRRIFMLSALDQMQVLTDLREYLAAEGSGQSRIDDEVEAKLQAVEVIREVVGHQALGCASELEARLFDTAAAELGHGGWKHGKIIRLFGRWSTAMSIADGKDRRKSARQSALARLFAGRKRSHEEHFAGVSTWLESEPVRETTTNYDDWAEERNATLKPGERPYPKSTSIRAALGIGWALTRRVAKGEITLTEALAASARGDAPAGSSTSGSSEFVSVVDIANMRGIGSNTARRLVETTGFPKPAFRLGDIRAWLRTDVEAHFHGAEIVQRDELWLQSDILSVREVSSLTGLSLQSLYHRACLHPQADGKVGNKLYWRRSDVEAWIEQNRELVDARLSGKPRGRPRTKP